MFTSVLNAGKVGLGHFGRCPIEPIYLIGTKKRKFRGARTARRASMDSGKVPEALPRCSSAN